ncbi:hypothetical protein IWX90DRAFT_480262 [Phyllosticta citrichinensis]|uniref:Uncharacterized protein n=1 Tax=Phyllosticta citrichinensis TaxID=1130410 RepID=A0ABR1XLM2_9PEZI
MHPIVTMTCRPGPVASRVSTMFFSFSLLLFSAANPPASADAKADVAVVAQCTGISEPVAAGGGRGYAADAADAAAAIRLAQAVCTHGTCDCRRGEPPFEEMGGQTERYTPSTVRTERVKAVKEVQEVAGPSEVDGDAPIPVLCRVRPWVRQGINRVRARTSSSASRLLPCLPASVLSASVRQKGRKADEWMRRRVNVRTEPERFLERVDDLKRWRRACALALHALGQDGGRGAWGRLGCWWLMRRKRAGMLGGCVQGSTFGLLLQPERSSAVAGLGWKTKPVADTCSSSHQPRLVML